MAVPHVAGTCALLLAANPLLQNGELEPILTAAGDPILPGICASNRRLNVDRALRAVIPPAGEIRLDRPRYAAGAQIGLLVADWDLRGAGRCLALVQTAAGDEEVVRLTETDVALGVLRGTIAGRNAPVTPGDGIVEVRDGEDIQVRYFDANDGVDGTGRWCSAGAVADYLPPALTGLEIKPQQAAAVIDLQTSEPTRVEVRHGTAAAGPYDRMQRDPAWTDRHSINLPDLAPNVPYYFVLALTDEAGNETLAGDNGQAYSFITGP